MRKLILFFIMAVTLNATTPTYENVTRLYVATFDRTPDVAGLKYWVNDSGLELEEIARSFFDQPETKAKYYPDGTIHLGSFVDEVYVNLFDRAPDSAGRTYWIDAMYTGSVHYSTFILAAINGAQGNDAVILADKTKDTMDEIRDELSGEYNISTCSAFYFEDNGPYYHEVTPGLFVLTSDHWYKLTQGRLSLICSYFKSNGRLYVESQYADGLRHGTYREYYDDGQLRHAGDYWNDKREGIWLSYWSTGEKESEVSYSEGIPADGYRKLFWTNGQLRVIEYHDANGSIQGTSYTYYESGKPQYERNWLDNAKHGKSIWHSKDGTQTNCVMYDHGREVGSCN